MKKLIFLLPLLLIFFSKNSYAIDLKNVLNQIQKDPRVEYADLNVKGNKVYGKVLTYKQKNTVINLLKKNKNISFDIDVFPFKDIGVNSYAFCNLPILNIREKPKHSSQLVTQSLIFSSMKVLNKSGEWIQITLDQDNYIGWVKKSDISLMNKNRYDELRNKNKVIVTSISANLFSDNKKDNIRVYMGSILPIEKEEDNYYVVSNLEGNKYYSDKKLYINKEDVRFIGKELKPSIKNINSDLIELSKKFISTPYLWGGASSLMLDCSGFTQLLYRVNGYSIPRDADQQQDFSKKITNINDLKEGDLVFFPGHVGMYIGDKKFIHSSVGYGGVYITSFDPKDELFNDWYIKNFQGGGRIINENKF
jgi:cell wall-associated NlpC family hydrolase